MSTLSPLEQMPWLTDVWLQESPVAPGDIARLRNQLLKALIRTGRATASPCDDSHFKYRRYK